MGNIKLIQVNGYIITSILELSSVFQGINCVSFSYSSAKQTKLVVYT